MILSSAAITKIIFSYFMKINKFLYIWFLQYKYKKVYLLSIYKIVRDKGTMHIFKQKFGCRN